MHDILELRGKIEKAKRVGLSGNPKLPKNSIITVDTINKIMTDIEHIINDPNSLIKFSNITLVSVHYNKIVAKSNRIEKLFDVVSPNNFIVGAIFDNNKHVITYKISKNVLSSSLNKLKLVKQFVLENFKSGISNEELNCIYNGKYKAQISKYGLTKNYVSRTLVDISFIEKINVLKKEYNNESGSIIVTFYDIGEDLQKTLNLLGINTNDKLDDLTYLLKRNEYNLIYEQVPSIIAMSVNNIADYSIKSTTAPTMYDKINGFSKPTNEPIIGVIDTLFDQKVFFNEWVEYHDEYINKDLPITTKDYHHGTFVSGLIVAGNIMNPHLDDGCGHFRVRHFGVALSGKTSSFDLSKKIEKIVKTNTDIVVWNLSLGSQKEIDSNYISLEAALLDKLQKECGVIFVISGTNDDNNTGKMKIGSPADSINGLVVNSVKFNKECASYTRSGPVLSFFNKPDVSYYGGDFNEPIIMCNSLGEHKGMGTSYAAPWISRKMGYLIHKIGMPREVAKALIIDSSTNWKTSEEFPTKKGYGVVPIKINDILSTKKDEIKFFIHGYAELYNTYAYNIPVPIKNNKYPYIAKATLCYFPSCSRNQGVDYTDNELDIHFGKLTMKKNRKEIKCINDNRQNMPDTIGGYEEDARKEYRKWDNIKHICEKQKDRKVAKDVGSIGNWGFSIKKTSRLTSKNEEKIPFGLVITLKNIYGDDHYEEFIQNCNFLGWFVNRININQQIDIYNKAEESIDLD